METQRQQAAAAFKAFILKNSAKSDLNLYDHLARLLTKVMDERPQNSVDVIEEMSYKLKRELLPDTQSTLRDLPLNTNSQLLAEQQRLLFLRDDDAEQEDELVETALPNVNEIGYYFEQAGLGLGREEMQRIFLALKQLVDSQPLQRCRLWGKILGTERNYIVAEGEYKEDVEEDEQGADEMDEQMEAEPLDDEEKDGIVEIDLLPRTSYKPQPEVPKEPQGTGVNKVVYYVCKEPGLPWVKLPLLTAEQVKAARQIHKFFTGRLDTRISSFPPFPGNEANYLRAQIARISAGTHVSPLGFFRFREEEDDEEAEALHDTYEVNTEFEGITVAELAESLSTWVHHVQHILQQGRCTWINLAAKPEDESEDKGEDEDKEDEPDEPEPEVGPPLLTPISEDTDASISPWTSRLSSTLTSQYAVAVLRSNLWPGAHAYARGKKFENIYIGWGLKFAGNGYSPCIPPTPQTEYPTGPEITEALDPTLEEEQAQKAAQEEQQAAKEEMESSEEEEEGG